jgi:hypothetical protein
VSHRFLLSILSLLILCSLASAPVSTLGQTRPASPAPSKGWTPPVISSGEPDLQGTWTSTTTAPLERSPQYGTRLFLTDEELAESQRSLARVREGDNRESTPGARISTGPPDHWTERANQASRQTSLVVVPEDGRVPVRPWAEERRDYNLAHSTDDFEFMSPWDRCITRGMPGGMIPGGYGNVYEIVQSPGVVAIVAEMIHETRVIETTRRPRPNIRQWNGDSIGHWEGNTLVVETTNYNGKGWIATNVASGRIKGIPISESLRVIERFTRTSANTIQYELTIDDPVVYTTPWKVTFPFTRDPSSQVFEYACHEGNYAMTNMLSGARAQEKAQEEAAKGTSGR